MLHSGRGSFTQSHNLLACGDLQERIALTLPSQAPSQAPILDSFSLKMGANALTAIWCPSMPRRRDIPIGCASNVGYLMPSARLCLDHKSSETSPAAPATKLMTARTPNAVVVRATCLHLALKLVLVVLVLCQSMQISNPQPISNRCFIRLQSSSLYHVDTVVSFDQRLFVIMQRFPLYRTAITSCYRHWPVHGQSLFCF